MKLQNAYRTTLTTATPRPRAPETTRTRKQILNERPRLSRRLHRDRLTGARSFTTFL